MYICSRDSCSCYIEEMDMKGRDLDQQYEKESEVVDSFIYPVWHATQLRSC